MKRYRRQVWSAEGAWAFLDRYNVIDEEFDDAALDTVAMRHQIQTKGAIALHPDGDRRNSQDDPVPLHSHKPDSADEYGEFFNRRLFARARVIEIREHHARMVEDAARYERAQQEYREQHQGEKYQPPRPTPPVPMYQPPMVFRNVEPVETQHQMMLRNLRVNDPPPKGIGRMWRQYLMVNEADLSTNPALVNRPWVEIWRGRGVIVMERDEALPWYQSDVTWSRL